MRITLRLDNTRQRTKWIWAAAVGLIALLFLLTPLVTSLNGFPESWNVGLREPLNELKRWVVVNRNSHWIFLFFFKPLSSTIDFVLRRAEALLLWLPWPFIIAFNFVIAHRVSGLRLGLLTTTCLLLMGMFGLWTQSMQTLALMTIAVILSLAIGIPLGIWAAQNDRVDQMLRPVLDAMQTMPAFVYLIPVVLFFGLARVPSAIATIIYALPPAIRLTSLGIRAVPEDALEAARAFGSTERQMLRKVQIPMALPAIMTGVNQTIMMALSIVVIAALIGSGGLGDVVLKSLRRLDVGTALEAGLAIVVMAILLDRLSGALAEIQQRRRQRFRSYRLFSEKQRGHPVVERIEGRLERIYTGYDQLAQTVAGPLAAAVGARGAWLRHRANGATAVLLLALLLLLLLATGIDTFPRRWEINLREPVAAAVHWMQVNLYNIGDSGIGTGPFRDFLITRIFKPLSNFFAQQLPWVVVVAAFTAVALAAGSWGLAVGVAAGMALIGLFGMWGVAMDSLSQTIVAVLLCILIGVPLGIWASRNDRVDQLLRPVNDFLQTIPIFVYLVPVIMLFGAGSVAGLMASVLYAISPVIRLTNLGIRQVDKTILESADCFGSTGWQKLIKIEIPLALPTIMLGINQTIMMVLAMVIIAGLVGATGLGLEVVQGFANDNLGRSVEAGLAIVLLAIVIDRITQAWAQRAGRVANVGVE